MILFDNCGVNGIVSSFTLVHRAKRLRATALRGGYGETYSSTICLTIKSSEVFSALSMPTAKIKSSICLTHAEVKRPSLQFLFIVDHLLP